MAQGIIGGATSYEEQSLIDILEDLPFIKDGKQTINIITSTRLEDNNKQKHYLINLDRDFIGMYHSEIKIFPSTYTGFKKLLDKYTFGESRSEENVKKQFNLFKNKPYIVVSFNNDLEGSSGNKTSAKIIPINAEGRSVDVLIDEASKIKTALNQELSDYFGKTTGDDYQKLKSNYKVSDAINVKTESLLDRSQILDILIEWGKTPYEDGTLLDLYTKEVEVSAIDGTPLKRKISLLHILDNFKSTDFFLDTVSGVKAQKVKNRIGAFHTIKPNRLEAELLSGIKTDSFANMIKATEYFLKQGVKRVFITLGAEGVFFNDGSVHKLIPNPKIKVVNATGARDAFLAALAFCHFNNYGIDESARFSMTAAILALSYEETINPSISEKNVKNKMKEIGLC